MKELKRMLSRVIVHYIKSYDCIYQLLLYFCFSLLTGKMISRARINKYADNGFPCIVPLPGLKYIVVNPPFITQDLDFPVEMIKMRKSIVDFSPY